MLFSFLAAICFFQPPSNWQPAQPKDLSSFTKIGFISKGKTDFTLSIHLAEELDVDLSLKGYVQAAKEIHLRDPDTTWRDLGPFKMKAGMGRLTEISRSSCWGQIRMLQAIYIHDTVAYLLTVAAHVSEFQEYRKMFVDSLKTLTLAEDLFTPLSNEKKEEFEAFFQEIRVISDEMRAQKWAELQEKVSREGSLGPYWQFLVLSSGHEKIYP